MLYHLTRLVTTYRYTTYTSVQEQIPPDADQHLDVWATENQPNASPGALQNMKSLSRSPAQPDRWWEYLRDRGKIIDGLERDLENGLNQVIDSGGDRVKSVRVRGASPVYRARTLQQVNPSDPNKPYDISVEGDSVEAKATQMILADWAYQATRIARDVAHRIRKRRPKMQVRVSDPTNDIRQSDYTDAEHFGNAAADRIARKTADKLEKDENS